MSQNDLTIANQGFASFRSDLNSALQALGSTNSGTSAPSTTFANQLFYDTTNNILKIRNEDNDAFISLFTLDQSNDNIESLTIDGTLNLNGSLDMGDNNKILIGAGDDLEIYHDGSNSYIDDSGTGRLFLRGNDRVQIQKYTGEDMITCKSDGAVELFHDNSKKFETTSSGVTVTGNIANASGNLTLDVAGVILLDADGGNVQLHDAGTEFGRFINNSSDFEIKSAISDKDIRFLGNDGGSEINALTLDMSDSGRAKFNSRANFNGASDQGILTVAANTTAMTTRSNHHITLENTSQSSDAKGLINYKTNADNGASFTPVVFGGITVDPSSSTRTGAFCVYVANTDNADVSSDERLRVDRFGNLLVGSSNSSSDEVGARLKSGGRGDFTVSGGSCSIMNRKASDGAILFFQQENSTEGSISVSGSTVSLVGGHLSRWSRLLNNSKDETIVKGTVMTNLDEMVEWKHEKELWTKDDELPDGVSIGDVKKDAYIEDNEQLNKMAVSSVEGDVNVAGVFVNWDNDDDWNDMNVAMTGDMVIRIAKGTTIARGDLLMSSGDGTAKPQGDDIVRSKTIAKVTSTNKSHTYDDGTYLVPCVLMAC